jgi:outer membrane protein assembly factor BamA
VGRDADEFPKYIGRPEFIRGYDRENYFSSQCSSFSAGVDPSACSAVRLLGSRVALANAELRFPLIRRFELGLLPLALPPLDGLVFYDAGLAWNSGDDIQRDGPDGDEVLPLTTRYPLMSYGLGLRLNLFGYAIVRWDYAKPLDRPGRKPFWTWSLGPSF